MAFRRRLLGLSATAAGSLRRSLATAVSDIWDCVKHRREEAEEHRQMEEARKASITLEMWRRGFVIVDYSHDDSDSV
jgi:hypothetical protein